MSTFQQIKAVLDEAAISYVEEPDTLAVVSGSDAGFDVRVVAAGDEQVVGYGHLWHEHFDSAAEARQCFLFGLTDRCRLESVFYGRMECRATVQHLVEGEWVKCSRTGVLFVPFWRRRSVRLRFNEILAIPDRGGA